VSQVNLLPPEILQRQKVRQMTYAVMGAGAFVILLVVAFYVLQGTRLSGVNSDIDDQNANNQGIQAQISGLQQYAQLQQEAQAKQQTLTAVYAYEVAFDQLLQDVSRVIPSDAFLTTLTFSVTPPAAATPGQPGTPLSLIGSMKADGTSANLGSISSWLTRSDAVRGWVNGWVTTTTRDPLTGLWTFSSGVDLTKDVLTPRGKKGAV
jgi:Tfp pilus assembly protein PilN